MICRPSFQEGPCSGLRWSSRALPGWGMCPVFLRLSSSMGASSNTWGYPLRSVWPCCVRARKGGSSISTSWAAIAVAGWERGHDRRPRDMVVVPLWAGGLGRRASHPTAGSSWSCAGRAHVTVQGHSWVRDFDRLAGWDAKRSTNPLPAWSTLPGGRPGPAHRRVGGGERGAEGTGCGTRAESRKARGAGAQAE